MSKQPSSQSRYHDSDRGYVAHWNRIGAVLDEARRREARTHGPKPYDWRIIDSLLQLGYLHGNRNPPTGLIDWQAKLTAAYRKRKPDLLEREPDE